MLRSLLIANRGEIAVRVMRTCRRLGIRTVAVYSDADARALHVAEADQAVRIGPPPASESYLRSAAIIEAARTSGAEAIHPGYGFLAENAEFAQACLDAGLIWVGPSPAAMRAVGDKARAKALAAQHDVPVLAGYHGDVQDAETLEREAERVGFPLLIKASAGGGGRGMRVVESASVFAEALEAARREARASFGDDRVLLERYVERPRHVEVQVIGDQHGNLIHLGERECSIQRRHQKLIEETPSPAVNADLRAAMGDAALRLIRAAGYSNAGTVEFLLEPDGRFAFLEVNARLQVEYPVTEAVTGLDLVELQLRVAAGEPLALQQADVRLDGHAIEVRVIAEDPLTDFMPSAGRIDAFSFGDAVRIDTWITPGAVVSPFYDSLLAKVIAHGPDRRTAIESLARALRVSIVDGVRNNVDLLLRVLEHPAFQAAELHTGFLDEQRILDELSELPIQVLAAAAAFELAPHEPPADPWRGQSAWRVGRVERPMRWLWQGREHEARVSDALDGQAVEVRVGSERVRVDGRPASVWEHADWRVVEFDGRSYRLQRAPAVSLEDTAASHVRGGGAGRLTAPMPGRIVKLVVSPGQVVKQNQPLVVLEAMKMEHVVEAPHAGIVTRVCVDVGEQVRQGTLLLELGEALE